MIAMIVSHARQQWPIDSGAKIQLIRQLLQKLWVNIRNFNALSCLSSWTVEMPKWGGEGQPKAIGRDNCVVCCRD